MFCRNCKTEMGQGAVVCVHCGVGAGTGQKFCQHCGSETDPAAEICVRCGVRLTGAAGGEQRSKIAAGMLGILVGSLGIHRFYLGFNTIGTIQLVLGLCGIFTCGVTTLAAHVWGIVDGVLILTGSLNKDAQGRPLKD